jgi:DNA modification methylase
MKPYYSHAGIQIFHGDCREILPTLPTCDLLLTDPPYGIGMAGKKGDTRRAGYENLGWDDQAPDRETFRLMFAASIEQVVWGANYFAPLLRPSMGWLVWDKGQRIDQSDGELAYTSRDAALRIFTAGRHLLNGDGAHAHPTQKPLALMKWCLSLFPDAKTVLDPFCGSGTTLVAAKAMGLTGVGIEMHEPYCEIAAKRLSQEVFDWGETA